MQQVQDLLNFLIETPSDREIKKRFENERQGNNLDELVGRINRVERKERDRSAKFSRFRDTKKVVSRGSKKAKRKAAKKARARARA